MGPGDAETAIEHAVEAQRHWRHSTPTTRVKVLRRWGDLIYKHTDDLARIMTLESGKCFSEAKGEVHYARSFIEFFAGEAMRANGLVIPSSVATQRLHVLKQPVGVCSLLTPWNFPLAMITRKVAPCLAAACSAVVKPAEDTPMSALALAKLADKAGVPKGVLNVVTCSRDDVGAVGEVLSTHADVRKVSFTGSSAVGKMLLQQAAPTVKRTSMELGGNAPFVVFDDTDLTAAVEGCMESKFRFSGQTCVCANRILVQSGVFEDFAQRLAQKVRALKVGDGLDQGTTQGPLINTRAKDRVAGLVSDALDKGAQALVGGQLEHELGGSFFPPTVLVGCTPDMRCVQEEIFGPVAALVKFDTEEEALALANSSRNGLAGYVYSRNYARAVNFAEDLEVGMVGINASAITREVAPFGGIKESGLGREGSVLGLEEYLENKYMCTGGM